jgi:hypothetical protein
MDAQRARVIDADERARGDDVAPGSTMVRLTVVASKPIALQHSDAASDLRAGCMIVCRAVRGLAAINDDLASERRPLEH